MSREILDEITDKVLAFDPTKADQKGPLKVTKMAKREALAVTRLINEVLVSQLSIPLRQIVNDSTFKNYTGIQRPDLLISEFEFDGSNEDQFITNLVAYAEVKDDCSFDDVHWWEAKTKGEGKAKGLGLPYYIVTNCKMSAFYNVATGEEIRLNGNPIREFQTIDIFRLIKSRLRKTPNLENILTNVDSLSIISESVFNKKLWELAKVYRNIQFDNNLAKIDFTIGFIALEYFEEKEMITGKKDSAKIYWSDCSDESSPPDFVVGQLVQYISRLMRESQFKEFQDLINKVMVNIQGRGTDRLLVSAKDVQEIYNIINSVKPLHGCGFDLFGAVYEAFASSKEKKEFGEYFTRRHYAHILAKLLLKSETHFNKNRPFRILDPACGTGGFLAEAFKVLHSNYSRTKTLNTDAAKFLTKDCFYGIDVKKENISRTKLNMFLVGDGHTNMTDNNSLKMDFDSGKWDYIITNPPYGSGTIKAETTSVNSNRTEIAFLFKIIGIMEDGGKFCIILPDGVLENPSLYKLRKEVLEKCTIDAIVSLPKFAFAPYTKEKTYAVFATKRHSDLTKVQKSPIWMYIIDNDGLANSDKRFPTKLRNNLNGWMHDEISGWVSTDGEEMEGILEDRWMTFSDDKNTCWINEKGNRIELRKGGFVPISKITDKSGFFSLLPEFYLRTFNPEYVTIDQMDQDIDHLLRLSDEIS